MEGWVDRMSSKIQLRRDTAANWTTNNPILASGEAGVETDTDRVKVGDGATSWTALPYAVVDLASYVTSYQLALQPNPPANPTLGLVWIQTLS